MSYKFNNYTSSSNSDKNSIGMVTCSNGKTLKNTTEVVGN